MKSLVILIGIICLMLSVLMNMMTQSVNAVYTGTITINADGTVSPSGAPISRNIYTNTYTLTDDISCSSSADGIVIYSSGITLDGAGHTVRGGVGTNIGIYLHPYGEIDNKVEIKDVVMKNLQVEGFGCGISAYEFEWSGTQSIVWGINITRCTIVSTTASVNEGYRVSIGTDCRVSSCYIAGKFGIEAAAGNVIIENTIKASIYSICVVGSEYYIPYNLLYHNNFIGQGSVYLIMAENYNINTWDNGYPSGGNYWINLVGSDPDGDGISNTPYTIHGEPEVNVDRYPLMKPVPIFRDGFESGNFNRWTAKVTTPGENAGVTNARYHHGQYSARFTSNGGLGTETAYCWKSFAFTPELFGRGYFYVATSGIVYDDDRFSFMVFRAGVNSVASAGWRRIGGVTKWCLTVRQGIGYKVVYSTSTPSLNRWYCVELHWRKGTTNGLAELWVNGVRVCVATGLNTAVYGNVGAMRFGLGQLIHCRPARVYSDCCVISNMKIGTEP